MSKKSKGLYVQVDHLSCADIEAGLIALQVPVFTLGPGGWRDICAERGSPEAAVAWLVGLADRHQRVIAVNMPTGADTSTTAIIAPPGWPQERLAAVVAPVRSLLAEAFGDIAAETRP